MRTIGTRAGRVRARCGYSFFDPPFFAGYVPIMLYGLVTFVAAMVGIRTASNKVS